MRDISTQLPNILSGLRVFLAGIFGLVLVEWQDYTLATIVFTLAVLTDFCDGWLARRYELVSKEGSFIDPLADKILVISAFYSFYLLEHISGWIVGIIALREIFITGFRVLLIGQGYYLGASQLGKWKTVSQCAAIYALIFTHAPSQTYWYLSLQQIFSPFVAPLVYLTCGLTVYSGAVYLWKEHSHSSLFAGKRGSVLAQLVASCGLLGYMPVAPGSTMSAVTAIGFYFMCPPSPMVHVAVLVISLVIGLIALRCLAQHYDLAKDPSWIVIDEFVGMGVVLLALPRQAIWYVIAFALFRFFDVTKKGGVNFFERLPGMWGVMLDDIAAALLSLLCLHTFRLLISSI